MTLNMTNKIMKLWNNYKYRFVPWISIQMKDNTNLTTPRDTVSPISVHHIIKSGNNFFLEEQQLIEQQQILNKLFRTFVSETTATTGEERQNISIRNQEVMINELGFTVTLRESTLPPNAGLGVFITGGNVKAGTVVALYPGTVYLPSEPLLLASIRNQFIFRCQDGIMIDGNNRGISKSIYKSCGIRDKFNITTPCCDMSWMSTNVINPLNVGQFINNENPDNPHNVIYQEWTLRIPDAFKLLHPELWQYLPNVWYNPVNNELGIRIVPIVAVRDIVADEELFSAYFTIVHN